MNFACLFFALNFVFLTYSQNLWAQVATQRKMGIPELISIAEKNNANLNIESLNLAKSQHQVTKSRSLLLPKVGLQSVNRFQIMPQETWSSSASLYMEQTLFDGGQNLSSFAQSQSLRDSSKENFLDAQNKMSLDVLKAFTQTSDLENKLIASKRKLLLFEQQFEIVSRQFRQGLKTQRDYQLLEADVELARLSIERLESEVFISYRDLEKTIGSSTSNLNSSNVDILNGEKILALRNWSIKEKTQAEEIDQSPSLKALHYLAEEKQFAYNASKRLYWPSLNLTGSVAFGSSDFLGPNTSNAWSNNQAWNASVGLGISWTLWDWGGTPAAVSQARADLMISQKLVEQKKLELKNEYHSLVLEIQKRARLVDVQKRIKDLETKSFQNIQKEYREGRAGYLDLTNTLERSIRAENAFEQDSMAYFLSVAEFFLLKGKLYENVKAL